MNLLNSICLFLFCLNGCLPHQGLAELTYNRTATESEKIRQYFGLLEQATQLQVCDLKAAEVKAEEMVALAGELAIPIFAQSASATQLLIELSIDGQSEKLASLFPSSNVPESLKERDFFFRLQAYQCELICNTLMYQGETHPVLDVILFDLAQTPHESQHTDFQRSYNTLRLIHSFLDEDRNVAEQELAELIKAMDSLNASAAPNRLSLIGCYYKLLFDFECGRPISKEQLETLIQQSQLLKNRLIEFRCLDQQRVFDVELSGPERQVLKQKITDLAQRIGSLKLNNQISYIDFFEALNSQDPSQIRPMADRLLEQASIKSYPLIEYQVHKAAILPFERVSNSPDQRQLHGAENPATATAGLSDSAVKQWQARRTSEKALYHQLVDLRQFQIDNLATILNSHANDMALFEEQVRWLNRYAIVSTLIALCLLFLTGMFLLQRRLTKVQRQLDSEEQRADHHQTMYEDLIKRVQRIQRMESLGLMASGVAHDFNNILVGVTGNAELIQLMGSDAKPDFVQERVQAILVSARKATDLAEQMLAYSGKTMIRRQEVGLNQLIKDLIPVLEATGSPAHLIRFFPANLPTGISVDKIQIERAIMNLISNASSASSADLPIEIRTGITSEVNNHGLNVFGSSTHRGEFAFVEVIDQGHGISKAEMEYIFEPFYSKSRDGRGLGLSVVYGVIRSHDGLIECESISEQGTRFRLLIPIDIHPANGPRLPASHMELASSDSADIKIQKTWGENKTILVIDDDSGVVEFCRILLEQCGWKVLVAGGGCEGLEKFLVNHRFLDCVLMDIVMPDMSASEILRQIEGRQQTVPIILMTGFSQVKMNTFDCHSSVAAIISKPFQAAELLKAIRFSLEQAHKPVLT